jgi:hypothetical protein
MGQPLDDVIKNHQGVSSPLNIQTAKLSGLYLTLPVSAALKININVLSIPDYGRMLGLFFTEARFKGPLSRFWHLTSASNFSA